MKEEISNGIVIMKGVRTEHIAMFAKEIVSRFNIPKEEKQYFNEVADGKYLGDKISYTLAWRTKSKHLLIIKQNFGYCTVTIGGDKSYVFYKTLIKIARSILKNN